MRPGADPRPATRLFDERHRGRRVQRGCPTFTGDVARQALLLAESGRTGVFNVVANSVASRFDYVAAIAAAAGAPCTVEPGPAFARVAPVSPNESALNRRLDEAGLNIMPGWRDALATYVVALGAAGTRDTRPDEVTP